MNTDIFHAIIKYMSDMGCDIARRSGRINIAYVEGMNPDGSLNDDAADRFNDIRMCFDYYSGQPRLLLCARATTEPGRDATFSKDAERLGGVARIKFGQYRSWRLWFHKYETYKRRHPALVQFDDLEPVFVHRDLNKDGFRTGDRIDKGYGINHHGTRPGELVKSVGGFSYGCLVGHDWGEHLQFINILRSDAGFKKEGYRHVFSSTIIDPTRFLK